MIHIRAVIAPAAVAALALVAALAGCGGGDDEEDAREAVRGFVEAANERDGERLCGELLTRAYMERATGATGERAEERCRRQLGLVTGLKLELVSVGRARVDGEEATVRATLATGGRAEARVFALAKEDGSWKLAGSAR